MINKENIMGIDAGGTYFKLGTPNLDILESNPLPYTQKSISSKIKDYDKILITGAGSNTIKQWFSDKNIVTFNELQCVGIGGSFLSSNEEKECIVLNIGSGTPILHVKDKKVEHLGGTGLGSATIVGLAQLISGIDDLDQITTLAKSGDPSKVNLLVGDLYENSEQEIGLPHNITASNFGKYQDWRHKEKPSLSDLLAGIHVLVAESISVIANQVSNKFTNDVPIVLTGGGTLNEVLVSYLEKTFAFLSKKCIIPTNAMYATLFGIFLLENLNSSKMRENKL